LGVGTVAYPRTTQRHSAPARPRGRWLLSIPIVMPLLVPVYDRINPQLWGIPFFFWYQMGCALVAIVVISFVYLLSRGTR
jgi:hypothetical protein